MPFGKSNSYNTFIRFMNQVLRPFISRFIAVYFDNILISSPSSESHLKHLQAVFDTLRNDQLYINYKKCKFFTNTIIFLGFIVFNNGVHVVQSKISEIIEWSTLISIYNVRSFHMLAYFYRRFIQNFSSLFAPIIECLKRHTFQWINEAESNFQLVKRKMIEAPVLSILDFEKLFGVNCDASEIDIRGALR